MTLSIFCVCTDDFSMNKVATQLTTAEGSSYGAVYAVDRDTKTCMRTLSIGQSSQHKTVWWKVDLGRVYNIYRVTILFKNYEGFGIVLFVY